jgi:transposase InsO family protein
MARAASRIPAHPVIIAETSFPKFFGILRNIDVFTRKVVGFAMNESMETSLILSALEMALGFQGLILGKLMSHSDRGSQYASDEYQKKLEELT